MMLGETTNFEVESIKIMEIVQIKCKRKPKTRKTGYNMAGCIIVIAILANR
jgi:hypothetical protein